MANTTNIYDPKQMTQALLESLPVRRFLSSFFGEEVHDTKSFQIDIWKGSRRLAPIVHPKMAGKVVDREKFRTLEYTPPYLKPKKVTLADDILTRQPGEVVYTTPGQNTPAQRAAALLGRDMAELDESIMRRVEAMCAEALFTGAVTVTGEGMEATTVDFDYDNTHKITLTGADLWSASTAKIHANLSAWKQLIAKDSGMTATDVVLGTSAAALLLENEGMLKLLNTWNLSIGALNPVAMPDGVTYLGRLTSLGLDLWTYDEWYNADTTNVVTPMVPVTQALMLARAFRATVHYGVIQDLEAGNFASRVFAKSWVENDPSARTLLVQSAPLPVIHQPNAVVVATVTAS